ncbi:MAG: GTP cyclohydrolase II [Acidobacteria bacterium]|nr:GTP cyclohydrolase II [Acidobacteriota bacterium]
MAPKDSSSAPRLGLGPDSPLEVVTRFETEALPFVAKATVPSTFGKFTVYGFAERLTGKEHLAIVSGEIDARKRVPVRIHSECWTGDVMGSLRCDCRAQLESALRYTGEHGGIVLYLRQEGRGIGLLNKLKAYALQEQGLDTVEANHRLGFADDLRTYDCAVEMLRFFGIHKVRLLTNNPRKIEALEEAGIHVQREAHQAASNPHNLFYLQTKARKSGHLMDFLEEPL